MINVKLDLPEGWKAAPADECCFVNKAGFKDTSSGRRKAERAITVTPADFSGAMFYLKATITLRGRSLPYAISIPLQKKDCAIFN